MSNIPGGRNSTGERGDNNRGYGYNGSMRTSGGPGPAPGVPSVTGVLRNSNGQQNLQVPGVRNSNGQQLLQVQQVQQKVQQQQRYHHHHQQNRQQHGQRRRIQDNETLSGSEEESYSEEEESGSGSYSHGSKYSDESKTESNSKYAKASKQETEGQFRQEGNLNANGKQNFQNQLPMEPKSQPEVGQNNNNHVNEKQNFQDQIQNDQDNRTVTGAPTNLPMEPKSQPGQAPGSQPEGRQNNVSQPEDLRQNNNNHVNDNHVNEKQNFQNQIEIQNQDTKSNQTMPKFRAAAPVMGMAPDMADAQPEDLRQNNVSNGLDGDGYGLKHMEKSSKQEFSTEGQRDRNYQESKQNVNQIQDNRTSMTQPSTQPPTTVTQHSRTSKQEFTTEGQQEVNHVTATAMPNLTSESHGQPEVPSNRIEKPGPVSNVNDYAGPETIGPDTTTSIAGPQDPGTNSGNLKQIQNDQDINKRTMTAAAAPTAIPIPMTSTSEPQSEVQKRQNNNNPDSIGYNLNNNRMEQDRNSRRMEQQTRDCAGETIGPDTSSIIAPQESDPGNSLRGRENNDIEKQNIQNQNFQNQDTKSNQTMPNLFPKMREAPVVMGMAPESSQPEVNQARQNNNLVGGDYGNHNANGNRMPEETNQEYAGVIETIIGPGTTLAPGPKHNKKQVIQDHQTVSKSEVQRENQNLSGSSLGQSLSKFNESGPGYDYAGETIGPNTIAPGPEAGPEPNSVTDNFDDIGNTVDPSESISNIGANNSNVDANNNSNLDYGRGPGPEISDKNQNQTLNQIQNNQLQMHQLQNYNNTQLQNYNTVSQPGPENVNVQTYDNNVQTMTYDSRLLQSNATIGVEPSTVAGVEPSSSIVAGSPGENLKEFPDFNTASQNLVPSPIIIPKGSKESDSHNVNHNHNVNQDYTNNNRVLSPSPKEESKTTNGPMNNSRMNSKESNRSKESEGLGLFSSLSNRLNGIMVGPGGSGSGSGPNKRPSPPPQVDISLLRKQWEEEKNLEIDLLSNKMQIDFHSKIRSFEKQYQEKAEKEYGKLFQVKLEEKTERIKQDAEDRVDAVRKVMRKEMRERDEVWKKKLLAQMEGEQKKEPADALNVTNLMGSNSSANGPGPGSNIDINKSSLSQISESIDWKERFEAQESKFNEKEELYKNELKNWHDREQAWEKRWKKKFKDSQRDYEEEKESLKEEKERESQEWKRKEEEWKEKEMELRRRSKIFNEEREEEREKWRIKEEELERENEYYGSVLAVGVGISTVNTTATNNIIVGGGISIIDNVGSSNANASGGNASNATGGTSPPGPGKSLSRSFSRSPTFRLPKISVDEFENSSGEGTVGNLTLEELQLAIAPIVPITEENERFILEKVLKKGLVYGGFLLLSFSSLISSAKHGWGKGALKRSNIFANNNMMSKCQDVPYMMSFLSNTSAALLFSLFFFLVLTTRFPVPQRTSISKESRKQTIKKNLNEIFSRLMWHPNIQNFEVGVIFLSLFRLVLLGFGGTQFQCFLLQNPDSKMMLNFLRESPLTILSLVSSIIACFWLCFVFTAGIVLLDLIQNNTLTDKKERNWKPRIYGALAVCNFFCSLACLPKGYETISRIFHYFTVTVSSSKVFTAITSSPTITTLSSKVNTMKFFNTPVSDYNTNLKSSLSTLPMLFLDVNHTGSGTTSTSSSLLSMLNPLDHACGSFLVLAIFLGKAAFKTMSSRDGKREGGQYGILSY